MAKDRDLSRHKPIILNINEIGTKMNMQNPARTGIKEPQPKPGRPNIVQTIKSAKISSDRRLKASPTFPNIVLVLVIMPFLILWDSIYRD